MTLAIALSGVKVLFTHDTEEGLTAAAALVNTAGRDGEQLPDVAALDEFVRTWGYTGERSRDQAELHAVRDLRLQLRQLWEVDEEGVVQIVNALLRDANLLPQLVRHDAWDYHLHPARPDAPLAARMAFEAAMALVGVVRRKELTRLRICAYPGCGNVVVDLTKNRSKRFCDNGCGNRAAVEAYRARKAAAKP
jgi:predicted RNA-binding Zn ribbon-like protein